MKITGYIYSLAALLTLVACGGGDDEPGAPQAPELQFPENNSECLEGEVSSSDPDVSTIEFRWSAAANTSNYELNITDLVSGETTVRNTSSTSLPVTLNRSTPYSWNVTSSSSANPGETAVSATWKFYNAGDGITSYAPFPADLIYPASGASVNLNGTGSINLRWQGADVDNDISEYEVLLDIKDPPTTSSGTTGTMQQINVSNLSVNAVYYWQVISTDQNGNSSISEVSQFRVSN